MQRTPPFARACTPIVLALAACFATSACASISLTRDTQTSGTFESTGFAFTIASIDLPKPAINIARDNASDARLTNMQVTESHVTPYLGWWDWLLDIIGMRWATVRGTWGFKGDEAKSAPGSAGSTPGS